MEFILSVTFKFINYEQRYMKPLCENGNHIYRF